MTQADDRASRSHALAAALAALEKQAEDVVVLELRAVSTITDYFLLCTADNARHLDALKEHLTGVLLQRGCRVEHTEGASAKAARGGGISREPSWILMDCGDLVVHLFDRQARQFYRIEDLWADAPRVPVVPRETPKPSVG